MAADTTSDRPLVETTFAACGHTARLPQTTRPASCPTGCDSMRPDSQRPAPRPRPRS
ncbi:hypothetical protein SAMN05421748_114136 [Paractinoplanes atraurantiacus]|uniref:Uncharacterized protein n=1 Tax=Paractinoplanes atraurantiacus TaxID=1036182 RepID=A0A285J2U5_9ACTN|nr:hypothetical protein SAMN05421748_114136 [Actinoplanes atraurantiacus]